MPRCKTPGCGIVTIFKDDDTGLKDELLNIMGPDKFKEMEDEIKKREDEMEVWKEAQETAEERYRKDVLTAIIHVQKNMEFAMSIGLFDAEGNVDGETLSDIRENVPGFTIPVRGHEIKTWPKHFNAVWEKEKSFELRKNDRNFRIGDWLILLEFNPEEVSYTSRYAIGMVSYILGSTKDGGLKSDFVCMSFEFMTRGDNYLYDMSNILEKNTMKKKGEPKKKKRWWKRG